MKQAKLSAPWTSILVVAAALFCATPSRAELPPVAYLKGMTDNSLDAITRDDLPARIRDFQALGVKWVRLELDWSVIQPTGPDAYDLRQQDMVIKALIDGGINVLGLLDYTPGWANGGKPTKFYPPIDNAAFAKFAAYLTARYAKLGVHHWEIWNEPNVASFWSPAANVAQYTALLKATYESIHQADPQAVVLLGGLAQPWDRNGDISALRYFRELYDNGAKPYFDAAADHPYFSPNFPRNTDGNNWQKMFNTAPSFRSIMAEHGDGAKMLWATEVGAPTGGGDIYGTVISEAAQATMIKLIYEFTGAAPFTWLGPVFWYNLRDFPGQVSSSSSECCFGLVRADGSHKPGFDAYKDAPATRQPN